MKDAGLNEAVEEKSQEVTLTVNKEDYPLSAVPVTSRKGLFSLAVVLLGFTYYTGTMFAGGTIGAAFKFSTLMWVILLGNLILGGYAAILGYIAYKSGLTSVLMARHSFGAYGARWVDFILGVTQVGWYGWSTAMTAIVFANLFDIPRVVPALMIFFGFAFCSTAWVGYKGLQWLSAIAVPAMTILIFWSLGVGLRDAGGLTSFMGIEPTGTMSFAAALTVVVGTYISGGTQATNWSRYAGSGKHAVIATLLAFFIGNGLMVIAGAFGAYVYQVADMVEVLQIQGLLLMGILLLILNIWTSQDNTIYSFSVAGCTAFHTQKRRRFVLIGAAVGTVIALLGIYDALVPFLVFLGTVIPPVGGVIMADFFVKHKGEYPDYDQVVFRKFNWVGIIAYLLGIIAAKFIPGITPINGIVGAFVGYILMDYLFNAIGYKQENQITD